jgi:predicted dehydrogenase
MQEVRIGIIGCGHLLQKGLLDHLLCEDYRRIARVVALCDAAPGRARAVAEEYGIPNAFEDVDGMLRDVDLDAVFVLTPVQYHYELAMRGIHAGKHVYVQKTMATTFVEAREMVEASERKRLVLSAAPGQMLSPAYRDMKRILNDGGVGCLAWCYAGTTTGNETETLHSDGLDTTWQYRHGGGALWNTSVYSLHTLTGILGPARSVTAEMRVQVPQRLRGGVPFDVTETDNALLTLTFDGGVIAVVWGCRSWTGSLLDWGAVGFYGSGGSLEATAIHMESGWPSEVLWRGSHGQRWLKYPKGGFATDGDWQTPLAPTPHVDIPEQHVYLDALDFANAVREGRPSGASPRQAAHVVEIIEKAYRAAETGVRQNLESDF